MASMDREDASHPGLGTSILGGAASGLSYEGALRDAMARDDLSRRREAGRLRHVPAPQTQPRRERQPEPAQA
jgi:hypothetical protein